MTLMLINRKFKAGMSAIAEVRVSSHRNCNQTSSSQQSAIKAVNTTAWRYLENHQKAEHDAPYSSGTATRQHQSPDRHHLTLGCTTPDAEELRSRSEVTGRHCSQSIPHCRPLSDAPARGHAKILRYRSPSPSDPSSGYGLPEDRLPERHIPDPEASAHPHSPAAPEHWPSFPDQSN